MLTICLHFTRLCGCRAVLRARAARLAVSAEVITCTATREGLDASTAQISVRSMKQASTLAPKRPDFFSEFSVCVCVCVFRCEDCLNFALALRRMRVQSNFVVSLRALVGEARHVFGL